MCNGLLDDDIQASKGLYMACGTNNKNTKATFISKMSLDYGLRIHAEKEHYIYEVKTI